MRKDQTLSTLLAATLAVGSCGAAAFAAPASKVPTVKIPQSAYVPDQILVMKHNGADADEINDKISEMQGQIVQTIVYGKTTAYVVNVPKGSLETNMRKVMKDKEHFDAVQRNWISTPSAPKVPTKNPNDPLVTQQWHIASLNTPAAWQEVGSFQLGSGQRLGVIDTGCQSGLTEIPNITKGATVQNGIATLGQTAHEVSGFYHGTFVSTCAAAQTNNAFLGSSPASSATIIPIDVYAGNSTTTDANILAALAYIQNKNPNCKVVNLSSNADPPYTFANQQAHPVLFAGFQNWYNSGNLLFNSAGNVASYDSSPQTKYLIVVTAINEQQTLASFSNYGTPVWFTAPGQDILSAYINDTSTTASGTSFASPLAASVAVSLFSTAPTATNTAVLNRMVNTANTALGKVKGGGQSKQALFYGYGEPDQGAALK